ncbi:hypothetical protein H0N95_02080 [Candidatus Micrarchaeota archaeon]|nr:hypothetical protein [Candidatus Micrarchaeota archaeon]
MGDKRLGLAIRDIETSRLDAETKNSLNGALGSAFKKGNPVEVELALATARRMTMLSRAFAKKESTPKQILNAVISAKKSKKISAQLAKRESDFLKGIIKEEKPSASIQEGLEFAAKRRADIQKQLGMGAKSREKMAGTKMLRSTHRIV